MYMKFVPVICLHKVDHYENKFGAKFVKYSKQYYLRWQKPVVSYNYYNSWPLGLSEEPFTIDCYGIALASVYTLAVSNYDVWYIPKPGQNWSKEFSNHLYTIYIIYIMVNKEFLYSMGGGGSGEERRGRGYSIYIQ